MVCEQTWQPFWLRGLTNNLRNHPEHRAAPEAYGAAVWPITRTATSEAPGEMTAAHQWGGDEGVLNGTVTNNSKYALSSLTFEVTLTDCGGGNCIVVGRERAEGAPGG
jgi:hypothetical protein